MQEVAQKQTGTIPLIQMSGSSKKRKHHEIEEDEDDLHPDYKLPENDLHTPVPKVNTPRRYSRGRKRASEQRAGEQECKKRKPVWNKQHNKRKNEMTETQSQDNNRNKNKGGRKQRCQRAAQQQQFQPFDYSSVDYSQFRGGGKSVSGTQKVKAPFKNRVRLS